MDAEELLEKITNGLRQIKEIETLKFILRFVEFAKKHNKTKADI